MKYIFLERGLSLSLEQPPGPRKNPIADGSFRGKALACPRLEMISIFLARQARLGGSHLTGTLCGSDLASCATKLMCPRVPASRSPDLIVT